MASSKFFNNSFKKFKRVILAGLVLIVIAIIIFSQKPVANLSFDQAYTTRVNGLTKDSDGYNTLLSNLSSSKQNTLFSINANNKDLKLDASIDVQASANTKTMQGSSLIDYDASFQDNTTNQKFSSTGSLIVDNAGQRIYATVKSFNLTSSDAEFINALVKTYIDKPVLLPITQEISGSLQAQEIVSQFAKLPAIIRESLLKYPIFKQAGDKTNINGISSYHIQVDQAGMKQFIDTLTNNPSIQQAFNISAGEISFEDLSQAFSGAIFSGALMIRDNDDVSLSIQSLQSIDKDVFIKADLYPLNGFVSITEQTTGSQDTQTMQLNRTVGTFGTINAKIISYTNNNISKPDIKGDLDLSISVSDDSFSSEGDGSVTFPLPSTSVSANPEPLTVQFDRSSQSTKADNLNFTEPTNPIKFEDLFGGIDGADAGGFDGMGINQPSGGDINPSEPSIEELNLGNMNP